MIKKLLRNERGLTLIELLAVVVILGIISAIAVPSIGGLIDNSKKDAHVANARQMINAAKMAMGANPTLAPTASSTKTYISLGQLEDGGYLDKVKDPDSTTAGYTDATPATSYTSAPTSTGSYVIIDYNNGKYYYSVRLVNANRGIWQYEENLTRDKVVAPAPTQAPSAPTTTQTS